MGSLTGAVSSKKVTEEFKGTLSPVGNRALSVNVEGRLTASPMGRAGAKAGVSDPAVPDGRAVAQQIKGTPGITGLSPLSVHSGEEVWHLNTSGCWTSNCLPNSRLITVNPSARQSCQRSAFSYQPDRLRLARQRRGKSLNLQWSILNLQFAFIEMTP